MAPPPLQAKPCPAPTALRLDGPARTLKGGCNSTSLKDTEVVAQESTRRLMAASIPQQITRAGRAACTDRNTLSKSVCMEAPTGTPSAAPMAQNVRARESDVQCSTSGWKACDGNGG